MNKQLMRRELLVFSKVISKKKRFSERIFKISEDEGTHGIYIPTLLLDGALKLLLLVCFRSHSRKNWLSVCLLRFLSDVRPSNSRRFLKGLILFLFRGITTKIKFAFPSQQFYDHPGLSLGRKRRHRKVNTSRIGWKHGSTDNTKSGRRSFQ